MKKPHTLTDRERNLIAVYSECQFGMTPRQFYVKWGVSYEQIASISALIRQYRVGLSGEKIEDFLLLSICGIWL